MLTTNDYREHQDHIGQTRYNVWRNVHTENGSESEGIGMNLTSISEVMKVINADIENGDWWEAELIRWKQEVWYDNFVHFDSIRDAVCDDPEQTCTFEKNEKGDIETDGWYPY